MVKDKMIKGLVSIILFLILTFSHCYGEMYKWVDERGTLHFTDDFSKIPEKYRPDVQMRKVPKETKEVIVPEPQEKPRLAPGATPPPKIIETQGYEVNLSRQHEVWFTEVVLNGSVKHQFIVDTGASFTLISRQIANELGISISETTPFIHVTSVSDVMLAPLVTLRSIRVGKAEVENVDTLVYSMPSYQGLLGNSFLNRFKVVIDSLNGKMVLYSMQGTPSPDRPGGYNRDYWVGQFRFYHRNLEDLRRLKINYESRSSKAELNRINNAIRYFEDQLAELERKASFAGVPRHWRE